MKVIHVVPLLDEFNSYGGPVSVAVEQAEQLRRKGNSVIIVGGWVGDTHPPTDIQGVPCRLFRMRRLVPGPRFAGLVSGPMLSWLARMGSHIDVAHLHLSRDLNQLLAGRVLQSRGVTTVTQTHGMISPDSRTAARWVDRLLTRRVLTQATTRFVLTPKEAERLGTVVPTLVFRQLGNGVGKLVRTPERRRETEDVDVLFLARLQERKGVMVFAEAARMLKEAGVRARFSVVGSDWGELKRLHEFIAMHGLKDVLRYEGAMPRDQALLRLQRADIYVLPSVNEPYPMSVLEAMAAQTATVCTDDCGFSGLLAQSDAAAVVSPEPANVAAAIADLVGDPGRRQRMAERGLTLIDSVFSIDAVTDVLVEEYRTGVHQKCGTATAP